MDNERSVACLSAVGGTGGVQKHPQQALDPEERWRTGTAAENQRDGGTEWR